MQHQQGFSYQPINHHHHHHTLNSSPCSHSIYYYITLPSCCCNNSSCCQLKNQKNQNDLLNNNTPSVLSPLLSTSSSSDTTTSPSETTTHSSNQQQSSEKIEVKINNDKKPYKILSHAIDELYQTEENYIYDLSIMVEICIIVLHQQKWIIKEHVEILSRNIKDILYFHQELYGSFYKIKCDDNGQGKNKNDVNQLDEQCKSIATTFLHFENRFMSLYIDYCQGHEDAWKLCTDYRNKPEWNEFIDQCQLMLIICQSSSKLPFSKKINNKRLIRFEDLLIKPVQRICRYQLLIKEIIRHANQCFSTSSTQSLLVYSFKSMYDIATEIDKQNEIRDSHEKTNRFIQRLESDWRIPKQLIAQLGYLVLSGAIEMKYQNQLIPPTTTSALFSSLEQDNTSNNNLSSLKSKYYGCFIFNTYIIFVRPKKQTLYEPKHWFPLHLAVLIDNGYESEFILKCQQHTFHCKATCIQEKQIWIKKIQWAQDYQKEHSLFPPKGLVSSLNSDFLTSFASTSCHPSDIHSIYQYQQLEKQYPSSPSFTTRHKLHRSNSVANYHDHHILSHPQHLQSQQQSSLLNKKRKSVLFPLSMSTSSPSILLMNDINELQYTKEKEEGEEEEIEVNNPSSPSMIPSKLSKMKRRHSSLDLLSITKNHLKSQRKNSIRETIDQKLKDVCTKDYLSSRVRHFSATAAGQRKSSVHSASTVSTPSSSPIPSLSLKNIKSPSSPINPSLHQPNNNNNNSSNNQNKSSSLNRFSLPLLHISPTNTTFMDDPSFTFTSSPMELNDQHLNLSPSPSSSTHSSSSPNHYHLPTSYSLPLNIHHNIQDITTTNTLSHHQNSSMNGKNHPKKKRNSLFLSSFQLSSLSSSDKLDNKKPWNLFSKGFKWSHFFKNTK